MNHGGGGTGGRLRVAVVGPCAAGKSTVVEQLRRWGFDAFAVGQEHSVVRDLWRRRGPDALVYLHVSYETVTNRRGPSWPRSLYDEQLDRLEDARRRATIVVDTGETSLSGTLARVVAALERQGEATARS